MIAPTTPTAYQELLGALLPIELLCWADDVISTLQREGYLELTGEQN